MSANDHMRPSKFEFTRRQMLRAAGATAGVAALGRFGLTPAQAATLSAFRGMGEPTVVPPSWDEFTAATGLPMEWLDITGLGNLMQEVLVNGRGDSVEAYFFEGGTQLTLGPMGRYVPLDESKIPLFAQSPDAFKRGPLYQDRDGVQYGVPTMMNADSFGYWPEALGVNLDGTDEISWAYLFESDVTMGRVCLCDNWTLTFPEAANYMKVAKGAAIDDPANPTPEEAQLVADFLIERKNAGQFRVLWTSYEETIDLLGNKEVDIINCWKPAVEALRQRGLPVAWALATEGYYKWGLGAFVPSEVLERGTVDEVFAALNFFLDGAYGANIAMLRGHGTANFDRSIQYAIDNNWPEADIAKIRSIEAEITTKYQKPFWNNLAPDHKDVIETEWERFKNA